MASTGRAQCPGGTLVTSGGRDYLLCTTALSGTAARTDCQSIDAGWDLTSISSNAENNIVRGIGTASTRYIGLNDISVEGTYVWYDGTAYSFTNWNAGEPNNAGDEDCVQMYPNIWFDPSRSKWNDIGCASTAPYVCESASGCGNSRISSGEACDDGNTSNGDGCSSACAVESGWFCDASQPSICVAGCASGVASSDGGNDYLYCSTTVNRAAALAACSALGATWDMAWITSGANNTYVRSLSAVNQWIGLNDLTTEGTYVWDGTHPAYTNWGMGQPNGGGAVDCVQQVVAGTWDDISCASTRAYVCRSSSSGCGNGAVVSPEGCDDGDTNDGDGCSSTCVVEPGYNCTGSPSTCTPACVGGNFRFRSIPGSPLPYTYREYYYCGTSTSWTAAEAVCASLGTGWHLTNVGDSSESTYVRSLSGATQWIGYNDVATEGTFVWSNGGPATYTNWNTGEPNNSGNEDCTEMQTGGWNDIACATAYPYVCEQGTSGAICGNGVIGDSELCDDGNTVSGDGCSSTCVVEDYSCTIPVDNGAASICSTPDHVLVESVRLLDVGGSPVLEWVTAAQSGTLGFFVERHDDVRDTWLALHDGMLLAVENGDGGAVYRLRDNGGSTSRPATYRLREYETSGHRLTLAEKVFTAVRDSQVSSVPASGYYAAARPMTGEMTASNGADPLAQGPGVLALRAARVPVAAVVHTEGAGVRALSVTDLAAALGRSTSDVETAIAAGKLALKDQGTHVPWSYDAATKHVLFQGNASDSVYSDARPYQVSLVSGQRMPVVDAGGTAPTAVGLGRVVTELEEDTFAGLAASPDPASDYWFEAVLSAGSAKNSSFAKDFTLTQIPADTASLQVRVFGAWNVDAAHPQHITVLVNGAAAGDFDVTAIGPVTQTVQVAASKFVLGKNTVTLQATSNGSAGMGGNYVDGFTLDYVTELDLGASDVVFTALATGPLAAVVSGSDVRVFDVTTGEEILAAEENLPGATEVRFSAVNGHRYSLAARSSIAAVSNVRSSYDGGLSAAGLAADLLIVTPHAMRAAADTLAALRRAEGLQVQVFNLEDVVDRYAGGLGTPAAITALLRTSASWAQAPRYVVLVGDGTFDYRHVMGVGPGAMPPALVSTQFGLYASDSSLADLNGDGVAELSVGRLPAHTAEEASAMVDRIAAYGSVSLADFTHNATFVAGENRGALFDRDVSALERLMSSATGVQVIRTNGMDDDTARAAVAKAITDGTFWFDYVGHGGLDRLDDRGLLTASDIGTLDHGGRAPIVTGMTCSISRFEVPGMPSLGDALLLGDKGGAIAVWAPTGVSTSADAAKVGERFGQVLLREARHASAGVRLGDVVRRTTQESVRDGLAPKDMLSVFALLGDPSMPLPDLAGLAAGSGQGPGMTLPDGGTVEVPTVGDDAGVAPDAKDGGTCAMGHDTDNKPLLLAFVAIALALTRRRRR